jgi:hypothetical protein
MVAARSSERRSARFQPTIDTKDRLFPCGEKLLPVTALSNNSLLSGVGDRSGAGGLLSGEIPGILSINICDHCEPIAR